MVATVPNFIWSQNNILGVREDYFCVSFYQQGKLFSENLTNFLTSPYISFITGKKDILAKFKHLVLLPYLFYVAVWYNIEVR